MRRKQGLYSWIKENRAELRAAIRRACPNVGALSDSDIAQWVLNDEGLYLWARSCGVKV